MYSEPFEGEKYIFSPRVFQIRNLSRKLTEILLEKLSPVISKISK